MNLLRARFHAPEYRPSWRTKVAVHWDANLRMLRRPMDIVVFTIISFLPSAALLLIVGLAPWIWVPGSAGGPPTTIDLPLFLLRTLATLAVFLPLQHVAFMIAMDLTYIPHVRATLRARGVPVCPACGHLLPPESPDASCPECGDAGSSATMGGPDS